MQRITVTMPEDAVRRGGLGRDQALHDFAVSA
jgi:hypothetical protein